MKFRIQRLGLVAVLGGVLVVTQGGIADAAVGPSGVVLFNSLVNTAVPVGGISNGMPAVDTFSRNKQNEPSITMDPLTGALVAGSNDEIDEPLCSGAGTAASPGSCPFASNTGLSGAYFSINGGATWIQPSFTESAMGVGSCKGRLIHTLPGYCEKNLESFGDAALAVGPAMGNDGRFSFANGSVVYYGNLAFPIGGAVPVVAVSRSMDDGAAWAAPVVASDTTNPVDFNDKDYVWADRNPKSPFFGTVYASWTLFQGAGRFGRSNTFSPEPIVVARSTDGGITWSSAIRLSQSANNGAVGGRQGSLIRTGPDGTVYVFWEGAIFQHSEQLVAISHDGGVTFSRPMPVAAVNDIPSPLPGSSFRDNSFPSADVNQATGAIYVTWADQQGSPATALIEFTESDDGGMTWSAPITIGGRAGAFNAFFPSVAASPDGHHVFVAWPAQTWKAPGTTAGPGVVTQFSAYNLRTDGAWSGGHLLSTAFGDPDGSSTNGLGAQFLGDYATAVSSNSTGWFVWTDTRNDASCAAVDAFRSGAGPKPNPDLQCPPNLSGQTFGNTDIFAGAVGF
jgi:BNR/Asp-box repeat protein